MNFSELKNNYPVYVLNKSDMCAVQGKVVNVNPPYFPQPGIGQMMQMPPQPQQTQRVVDVTVSIEGKTQTFTIPESSAVTYAQTGGKELVLSTDKQGIIREVEVMKSQSEEVISSVEKHKAVISGCEKILESWNPTFAEKKEQEKKITKLETQLENMHTEMGKMGRILEDIAAKINK